MEKVIKQVENYPNYLVDICGRVWSKARKKTKLLKGYKELGYKFIFLCERSKKKRMKIARLVAQAFIPNSNNYPCVCHKDNNRSNDKVENLYWGTYRMNTQQAVREGRMVGGGGGNAARGEKHYAAKLNNAKVKLVRMMYNDFGWTQIKIWRILGKMWGVSRVLIYKIIHNKTWNYNLNKITIC
jgi:hypothetical protein